MEINLDKIQYYILNCENIERKTLIIREFSGYNIFILENKKTDSKFRSEIIGMSKIIDKAVIDQKDNILDHLL